MADYNINAVTRRAVFTGSAGLGPYAFTFEIIDSGDLAVYFNATLLTLTTDYTVAINANGTGSVTIVTGTNVPSTPTASDQIVIVGARDIERTTDFVTAGDLLASSLNEQLDSLTIFDQQVSEEGRRAMRAPVYDPALVEDGGVVDMTLPTKASRAGKTLAFDSNGNPVVGEDIGNWRNDWAASVAYGVRDIVRDASNYNIYRCNTAHTSSGSTPISSNTDVAKWDLVIDASYAATQAANAAASATASANSATASATSATASAGSATNAATSEQNANDWAVKTNGIVDSTDYSSKAWAIGGTGVTDASGAGPAKDWATDTTNQVDGTEYSAKEYAIGVQSGNTNGSAKQWSLGGGTGFNIATTVDGTNYSARYWADQAASTVANFDEKYYGNYATDAAAEDAHEAAGKTVTVGDLYYNTTLNAVRYCQVAPSGSGTPVGTWASIAQQDLSSYATNGFAIAMAIAL